MNKITKLYKNDVDDEIDETIEINEKKCAQNLTAENMIKDFKNDAEYEEVCAGFKYFPQVLPAVHRIIAIGDVHGDFELLRKLLKLAKVIVEVKKRAENNTTKYKDKWIGGNTYVIQTGDAIDSYRPTNLKCMSQAKSDEDRKKCYSSDDIENDSPSDIRIINYMDKLHRAARRMCGAVICLMGNHELLNIFGKMDYVSFQNIVPFSENNDFSEGLSNRKKIFSKQGEYGKMLICTHPTSIIIGQNLFVHAGMLKGILNKFNVSSKNDVEILNKKIRLWLLGKINEDYIGTIVGSNKISPFWNRILGSIPHDVSSDNNMCEKYLEPVLKTLHVKNMIIAHTPQFYVNNGGINKTCDDKLWRIDTGSSKVFNQFDESYMDNGKVSSDRKPQVLEILDDHTFNILV